MGSTINYESQYETRWERTERQANRIWRRLGGSECDDVFPPKPKGMHWTTYERLAKRYEELTNTSLEGLNEWLKELSAKIELQLRTNAKR